MLPHSDISELITLWLRTDDVLSPPFLKHVILWKDEDHKGHQANDACAKPNYPIQVQTEQVGESVSLESLNIERLTTIVIPKASTLAPPKPGPYLWQWGGFHSIYRLYEDKQKAFFSGIMQHGYGESFTEQRPTTHIPVPSRLYYPPPTNKLPLSGLRFGVKDIIDIAGLRTSVGSRSYYALYSAKESTAPAIQMLLSLGAVLVGKTKNTQFANGEDPQEWIDYSCPWNPRGNRSRCCCSLSTK